MREIANWCKLYDWFQSPSCKSLKSLKNIEDIADQMHKLRRTCARVNGLPWISISWGLLHLILLDSSPDLHSPIAVSFSKHSSPSQDLFVSSSQDSMSLYELATLPRDSCMYLKARIRAVQCFLGSTQIYKDILWQDLQTDGVIGYKTATSRHMQRCFHKLGSKPWVSLAPPVQSSDQQASCRLPCTRQMYSNCFSEQRSGSFLCHPLHPLRRPQYAGASTSAFIHLLMTGRSNCTKPLVFEISRQRTEDCKELESRFQRDTWLLAPSPNISGFAGASVSCNI